MKKQSYRIRGRVYTLSSGFVYDMTKAALVPCVVVERPGPFGRRLPLASAKNTAEGVRKPCEWVSIPVTCIQEFSI